MKQIKVIDSSGNTDTMYVNPKSVVSIERAPAQLTETLSNGTGMSNLVFSKVLINEGGSSRQVYAIGSPDSLKDSLTQNNSTNTNNESRKILHD